MYKRDIKFSVLNTKINISFCFIACVCLMFLLDNNYNAFMSVLAIFLHELAHIIALYMFGGKVPMMTLSVLEMNIKANDDTLNYIQKFFVALSGPFINIVLFVIFHKINLHFAQINLIIACFQLLPINSLDGDKALESLGISNKIRQILSLSLAFVFAFIGFYVLLKTKYNFSVLFISLFLLFKSFTCKF